MQVTRKLFRKFVIIVIIFVVLFSCEIALRLIYPKKIKPQPKNLAYRFNRKYLVSLKPNIEKTYVRTPADGGDTIHWKTNKDSFRGQELKENADIRIIVYGDSNIQARFSDLENTFTYKLERKLQEITKKDVVEVINAGIVGFGPDQSLIKFTQEVDIYHPDIVIFHVFADNDFGDIIRNRLFELNSSGYLVETEYEKTVDQYLEQVQLLKKFQRFISSLLIVQGTKAVWRKIKYDNLLEYYISIVKKEYSVYKKSKPRSFSLFADHYDYDVALYPESESSKIKIKLMNAILNKAKNLADSRNINFMVLIQPSMRDLTTKAELNYEFFSKFPGYKRTNLTSAIDNICIQNNIHRVNLFDVFLQNKPENLFFTDDIHWNDAGQEIAAQETAYYISKNMLSK